MEFFILIHAYNLYFKNMEMKLAFQFQLMEQKNYMMLVEFFLTGVVAMILQLKEHYITKSIMDMELLVVR